MTELAHKFHEQWLGMVQPSEGLVLSVPVLVDAQCMQKQDRSVQARLLACTARDAENRRYVPNLSQLLHDVLGLGPERFDTEASLPKPLRLWVPEGKQQLRPSLALKRPTTNQSVPASQRFKEEANLSAAASAGQAYLALIWDIAPDIDLDQPETVTGPWEYSAQAKFDRLLRECHVPIGILSNGRELRLTYAPHGESSGWLSFRVDAMCEVGGRPILDALVMLLGQERWFAVAQDVQLPSLLQQSRGKQGEVTNALARQMFEALEELLGGFSAAAERDRHQLLRRALEEGEEGYVYSGLLTVLLRLVFTLYCEDRGLLPVEHALFAHNYSLFGLYDELEKDHGRYPDSMDRRLGAYARLLSLFRAMYSGIAHGDPSDKKAGIFLPPRHGDLFDPNRFPFLEGWPGGSAPFDAEQRARVDVPTISDGTVYRVLKNLILLDGQRLSYRALDVEQIGSVYEALMGFDVERIVGHRDAFVGGRTPPDPSARPTSSAVSPGSPGAPASAGAIRLRLSSKKGAARVWLDAAPLLQLPAARRAAWLTDELGFDKAVAAKISEAIKTAKSPAEALTALEPLAGKHPERVGPGALVIQPGPERRRTSSHYT
ncbi:MAG TPA: hypothetical protein VN764_04810, partial [Polyangiaceae bacterium]|nr:hypothetical protein [Polyangiaceae bacterium]